MKMKIRVNRNNKKGDKGKKNNAAYDIDGNPFFSSHTGILKN